jgi:hypothetical protein
VSAIPSILASLVTRSREDMVSFEVLGLSGFHDGRGRTRFIMSGGTGGPFHESFESNFDSKSGQLFERRICGKMDLKRSMGKRPFQYQYLGIILIFTPATSLLDI